MDLRKTRCEALDLLNLAQDRVHCHAVVNMAMILRSHDVQAISRLAALLNKDCAPCKLQLLNLIQALKVYSQ
jgi:hypothetical protein